MVGDRLRAVLIQRRSEQAGEECARLLLHSHLDAITVGGVARTVVAHNARGLGWRVDGENELRSVGSIHRRGAWRGGARLARADRDAALRSAATGSREIVRPANAVRRPRERIVDKS